MIDILNGVYIQIKELELTAIIGSNGAGKCMLLRTILGLMEPQRVKVHSGREINPISRI